ncbi:hypothetical protein FRC09_006262, partial [Ceratobasidium sp. 395]
MSMESKRGEIKALSFDGGGVCALSALVTLQEFMRRLQAELGTKNQLRPCEYFDMIAGAGTGGLIAILLGRLGMSVDEAIEAYQVILSKTFSEKKLLGGDTTFKATNLENAITP